MDVEFCHWLQGEQDQAYSEETPSVPTAGAGLKVFWAPQSVYYCSASPGLRPLTNPQSEARKCLHTLKSHFLLSLMCGSEIVEVIFTSVIHQGWYVLYSRAAKWLCSYYCSYTEEMCNWSFIMLPKKLLRTRPGQPFYKTKQQQKVLRDGR